MIKRSNMIVIGDSRFDCYNFKNYFLKGIKSVASVSMQFVVVPVLTLFRLGFWSICDWGASLQIPTSSSLLFKAPLPLPPRSVADQGTVRVLVELLNPTKYH